VLTHRRPSLTELMSTCQALSYRDILTREIATAHKAGDTHRAEILTRDLHTTPAVVGALDALTADHTLATLLLRRQQNDTQAAREAGATWQQIATATGTTIEQACANYLGHTEQPRAPHPPDTPPPSPTTTAPATRASHTDRVVVERHQRGE
jgi:hypothetical protein